MPIETHENCAVLFADMSGSTKLYLVVGDDRAREIVAKTLERWSQLTVADGGQVIQLRGDGMLCTFPTVDAALVVAPDEASGGARVDDDQCRAVAQLQADRAGLRVQRWAVVG